jgi:L-aminopeptidase/D-esterase-like protein
MERIDITFIKGFRIGQAQNPQNVTGCTAIISESGAVCGVDVRGGSPTTRDTDSLNPLRNRKVVHAVLLTGGSSFGLAAADGVMRFLEERKIGRDVGVTVVPNVCAAALFDLKPGSSAIRPDAEMGRNACESAFRGGSFHCGRFGAGTGCTVGKALGPGHTVPGGIGAAAYRSGDLQVGAVVAVNCVGDVVKDGTIIAGTINNDGSFADGEGVLLDNYAVQTDVFNGRTDNTILGCVITNARLEKAQACKLASVAQNGVARVVRPAHTTFDGDIVFTMCAGEIYANPDAIGILAVKAMENAIWAAFQGSAMGIN